MELNSRLDKLKTTRTPTELTFPFLISYTNSYQNSISDFVSNTPIDEIKNKNKNKNKKTKNKKQKQNSKKKNGEKEPPN